MIIQSLNKKIRVYLTVIFFNVLLIACGGSNSESGNENKTNINVTPPAPVFSVLNHSPINDAENIPTDVNLIIDFNQEITQNDVQSKLVDLSTSLEVQGSLEIKDKRLTFSPSTLLSNATKYQFSLKFLAQTTEEEFTSYFTTSELVEVTVADHVPSNQQSNVNIYDDIEVTLSESTNNLPVNVHFSLTHQESEIKGDITVNNDKVTFHPNSPLDYSTQYTVSIAVTETSAEEITPYQFTFSTQPAEQRANKSYHPEIRTYGKTHFSLVPIEQVKANEAVKVSFGIPFPKDYLNNIDQFRILDESGSELNIAVKEILPWRSTNGETSIRSALVQLSLEFTNDEFGLLTERQLTLEWGVDRTANSLPLEANKDTWILVDDSEYSAEDQIFEPLAYAVFQPSWYGNSVIKTRLLPSGTHPDFTAYDSAFELFGETAINRVDPRVIDAKLIPHKESYAAWLFDRAMTIYQLAFKTGKFKFIRAAHRASQFYLQHISEQGYFTLKPSNDMKYSYGEGLITNYILQGDPSIPGKIEQMIPVWDAFNVNYTLNTNFWTERHAAFKLLGYVTAYEITGKETYFTKAQSTFLSLKSMQDTPQEGVPKTGALMHTRSSHGEGGSKFIASPWMSTLLLDAVERYYIHFEDSSALSFTIKMADFFKLESISLYEWKGWKGLDSYYVPHYLAGIDLSEKEHGGEGSSDLEHAPDVMKIFSSAYFSSCVLGDCDDSYLTTISKLYNSTITYSFPYWIRTAAPSIGKSAYRLSPPRKFNWWFKTTANLDFLIGQETSLPIYKAAAPLLKLTQEHQASKFRPEDEITINYKLTNVGNIAAKNIIISAKTLKYSPDNLLNITEMSSQAINRSSAVVWKINELAPGEVISDLSFTVNVNQFPVLPTPERPLGNILSFANVHYCNSSDSEDICRYWESNWDIGTQPYISQSNWQVIPPSPPVTPPTINIVNPIMHDTLSGLSDFIVEVEDSDTVAKVEFWLNDELLNTFLQAPYNVRIQSNELADKEHIFTVKAWDAFGSYKEDSVIVSAQTPDLQAPIVEILSPIANAEYCDVAEVIYQVEDNYTIDNCTISVNDSQKVRPNCGPYSIFNTIPFFKSQAHLTFDQSNDPLISQDGYNLIGTGENINYEQGFLNNAIYFNDNDSVANFLTTKLSITNDVTVSFWLKPEASEGMILSQDWGYIGNEKGWAIYLGANNHRNNNELSISWSSGNNTNNVNDRNVVQTPSGSITLSQWQHITVRKQGTKVEIFINGELSASQTIAHPNINWPFNSNKQLSIANPMNHPGMYNKSFLGGLDELAIWNEALSDSEIHQLYGLENIPTEQQLTIKVSDKAGNIGTSAVSFTMKSCE